MTRIFTLLIISALSMALNACGGKGADTPIAETCGTKSLFSTWDHPTISFSFSLDGMTLNTTKPFSVYFSGGARCDGSMNVTGSTCRGSYTVSGMTWNSIGGSDPGCASFNDTGIYTKSFSGLSLCNLSNSCTTYR
jgi:hypothetical protein